MGACEVGGIPIFSSLIKDLNFLLFWLKFKMGFWGFGVLGFWVGSKVEVGGGPRVGVGVGVGVPGRCVRAVFLLLGEEVDLGPVPVLG